jgi:hypothetical protein
VEAPLHDLAEQRTDLLEEIDSRMVRAVDHREELLRLFQVVVEQHPPKVGTALFVEEVLNLERAVALLRIGRVEGWLRPPPLDLLDDLRGIADRTAGHLQDRHRAARAQAARRELLHAGRHRPAYVRDALVVERPPYLLVVVRDLEVPEDRHVGAIHRVQMIYHLVQK